MSTVDTVHLVFMYAGILTCFVNIKLVNSERSINDTTYMPYAEATELKCRVIKVYSIILFSIYMTCVC